MTKELSDELEDRAKEVFDILDNTIDYYTDHGETFLDTDSLRDAAAKIAKLIQDKELTDANR